MRKKLVILLMCTSLTCALMTGCGDKKDSETKATQSAEETQDPDATEDDSQEPDETAEAQSSEPEESAKTSSSKTSAPKASTNTKANSSTKATKKPEPTKKKVMATLAARIENSCEKMTIKELYVSSYGEDAWGDNLLTKSIAYEKTSKRIKIKMPVEQQRWDIKVIDSKGKTVIFRELDVSECDTSNITITLMYDEEGNPIAIAV